MLGNSQVDGSWPVSFLGEYGYSYRGYNPLITIPLNLQLKFAVKGTCLLMSADLSHMDLFNITTFVLGSLSSWKQFCAQWNRTATRKVQDLGSAGIELVDSNEVFLGRFVLVSSAGSCAGRCHRGICWNKQPDG